MPSRARRRRANCFARRGCLRKAMWRRRENLPRNSRMCRNESRHRHWKLRHDSPRTRWRWRRDYRRRRWRSRRVLRRLTRDRRYGRSTAWSRCGRRNQAQWWRCDCRLRHCAPSRNCHDSRSCNRGCPHSRDSRMSYRNCRNVPRNKNGWGTWNSGFRWTSRRDIRRCSRRDSLRHSCRREERCSERRRHRRSCRHHRGSPHLRRLRRGNHRRHRRRDHRLRAARMPRARTGVLWTRLPRKET